MKQILYNLLSNAVKFTPDGGEITLSARRISCVVRPGRRRGDSEDLEIIEVNAVESWLSEGKRVKWCVEIVVSDTGIGIRAEDLERIFDPFEQADGTVTRKYQGTGLGLTLTRTFLGLHGGRVWAESQGDGKGSAFHVILPG